MAKSILLEPIRIGTMELSNRFWVPAMGTEAGKGTAELTQQHIDYYVERAKGGFGLITTEVCAVDPSGRSIGGEVGIWNDDNMEAFKKLADGIHKYGSKLSIQLHHCGRETTPDNIYGQQPLGVTGEPCPMYRTIPHEMTTEEIYDLIEKFGDAAVRAKRAGADAVEIHGGHSYLLAQFTSSMSNHRVDEFGGCLENRMRFSKLVIENIKRKAGNSFPVIYRTNGEDWLEGGITRYDAAIMAKYLEDAGADAISVTLRGRTPGNMQWTIPPAAVKPGYSLEVAAEVKKAVSIPVISVGRHTEPYLAEHAIRTGKVDIIAFGRQSIADPHLPNKYAAHRLDELIPCIGCLQGCYQELITNPPLKCLANPLVSREGEKLEKTDSPKKIMVVGGGPAGLVVSWLSASKGHNVTCYEKTEKLGGELRIAAHPPTKGSISHLVGSYITNAKKNGVKFVMNKEVTAELVSQENPDAVILCTGATPACPNIPGIKNVGAVFARDILDGKHFAGQNVLVIGGGLVGAETANFLGEHGRNVTVLEMLDTLVKEDISPVRMYLLDSLERHNVTSITSAMVKEFIPGGVVYTKDNKDTTLDGFDTIVLAMGYKAYNPLEEAIKDSVKELYVIGDAKQARNALRATEEAGTIALKI